MIPSKLRYGTLAALHIVFQPKHPIDFLLAVLLWPLVKPSRTGVAGGSRAGAESNSDAKTVLFAKRLYLPEWRREVIEKLQRGERNNSSPEISPES